VATEANYTDEYTSPYTGKSYERAPIKGDTSNWCEGCDMRHTTDCLIGDHNCMVGTVGARDGMSIWVLKQA
jgi:hypothetical protein